MTSGTPPIPATEQASQRLAMALRAGDIGTWHWDLATGEAGRDASMDLILGVVPGTVSPAFDEYLERVHPDDRPEMGATLRRAIAEQAASVTGEHRVVRPDGAVRWLEAKAQITYTPDGRASELVGVVVDITDRRRSEAARTEARAASQSAAHRVSSVERRLAMLARAADLLDAPLDLDAALEQVAVLAIGVLADWCTVDLLTNGRIHHAAVAHRDPAMVARAKWVKDRYPQDVEEPTFRNLITTREPLFVEQIDDTLIDDTVPDPEYRAILREFALSSFLVVPLVAGGRAIGTITLAGTHGRRLDPDDVEIALELGRRAGSAVEKTRLYAELQETSRVLQSSLLPARLPQVPGLALSAHYRGGTEGMQIGGDFYDVFRTGPDRWWVALGDVCGKGAAAAALTAAVRYSLRAIAPDTNDPGQLLVRLNEVLVDQVEEGQFTSLVLATFSAPPDQQGAPPVRLRLASGGHPPALLRTPEGSVGAVAATGALIGMLPDVEIATVDLELLPGATLLLYTDGATEARLPGEDAFLDEDGLAALLAAAEDADPETLAPRLASRLLELTGSRLRDDLALLTLSVPRAGS